MSTLPERTYRIHPMCAWRRVDDHVFILTDRDAFLTLADPVGLTVWSKLEAGEVGEAALVECVLAEFDVARPDAEHDVAEFLELLVRERGLEILAVPAGESGSTHGQQVR